MKIEGTFKSVPRKNLNSVYTSETFNVKISNGHDNIDANTIVDPTEDGYDATEHDVILFGKDPVHITCERQDLTQLIMIAQAQIKLVVNEDMSDRLYAYTDRSLKVTISRVADGINEQAYHNCNDVFYGYVDPINFDQGISHYFEEITITATDPLGALEQLTMDDLDGVTEGDTINVLDFILKICQRVFRDDNEDEFEPNFIGLSTVFPSSINPNSIKVNTSPFFGDDPDSRLTLYEALNELLKYIGATLCYDPAGKVVRVHSLYSEDAQGISNSWFNPDKDMLDAKSSMSMDDVYSKITLTCDIEPVDDTIELIDNDNMYSDYKNYQKYMTELVSPGEGLSAYNGFVDLLTSPDGEEHSDDYTDAYKLDHFCYVKRNDAWKFGTYSYINYMGGTEDENATAEQRKMDTTRDQSQVLTWLKENSVKAAFVSFGKGEKINVKDNSPVNNISMTDYLVISINGHNDHRESGHSDVMFNYIQDHSPICSYVGLKSLNLTPTDESITNYILISGKILLNPLQKKTGPNWSNDVGGMDDYHHDEDNDWANMYTASTNKFSETKNHAWDQNSIIGRGYWMRAVPHDNDRSYYQQKWWNLMQGYDPTDPKYIQVDTIGIHGDLGNQKNEMLEYSYTAIGNETDTISKLPILACQLKVGDKWCVERLDKGMEGQGVFEWMTDAEWQASPLKTKGFDMPYFTIGINPTVDQKIVGKSYDIQPNVWYSMNISGKGTAIAIKIDDKLNGIPEFKILGPILQEWNEIERIHPTFWRHTSWNNHKYWTLELLDSILISDFKIEFLSDNAKINEDASQSDNDLVYESDSSQLLDKYVEKLECDLKICTPLTMQECTDLGIKYKISNSYVMTFEDEPFKGWKKSSAYIKPEQLFIDYYYKQYNAPARIINADFVGSFVIGSYYSNPNSISKYVSLSDLTSNYLVTLSFPGVDTNAAMGDPYYCMSIDWKLKNKETKCKFRERLAYTSPL